MPDHRVATVTAVAEEEATGIVAEIFADIRRTKNLEVVPNFWRTLAVNPTQLQVVWNTFMTNTLADGYQIEPDVLPKVDADDAHK